MKGNAEGRRLAAELERLSDSVASGDQRALAQALACGNQVMQLIGDQRDELIASARAVLAVAAIVGHVDNDSESMKHLRELLDDDG